MSQGFHFEEIRTDEGVTFLLATYAVEPCYDVALLGELDGQQTDQTDFQADVEAFESFYENTEALTLCTEEFELFKAVPVYVYTHERKWVTGTAKQCRENAPSLFVEFDDYIKGGTSGSAIVNEKGEIVALVSLAGGTLAPGADPTTVQSDVSPFGEKGCSGPSPRPVTALPVWAVRNITGGASR
jgi:hypothetical protein